MKREIGNKGYARKKQTQFEQAHTTRISPRSLGRSIAKALNEKHGEKRNCIVAWKDDVAGYLKGDGKRKPHRGRRIVKVARN